MMIVLNTVHMAYAKAPPVFTNLNIRVAPGEFLCVLGPSGCGKTTLLNLMAGFFTPTRGSVYVAGQPVQGPGPDRGLVFQDAQLFPWLTIRKNIEFGLRLQGFSATQRRALALAQLQIMGLRDQAEAYPYTLSGGMRQRVALARTLALDPAVLLLDEPFSALDVGIREHLQDELLGLWQARGWTVVYVTHSPEEAAYLADRILVFSADPKTAPQSIQVALPRPRQRCNPELLTLEGQLRTLLRAPFATKDKENP